SGRSVRDRLHAAALSHRSGGCGCRGGSVPGRDPRGGGAGRRRVARRGGGPLARPGAPSFETGVRPARVAGAARRVREPAPGRRVPGPRRPITAQGRSPRERGRADRAGAHGRPVLRRAARPGCRRSLGGQHAALLGGRDHAGRAGGLRVGAATAGARHLGRQDRKSTRLNSSHVSISYAVFCLKKKKKKKKKKKILKKKKRKNTKAYNVY